MSGLSLADVVVHRNSAEPARLGALAYTRGGDIHLAPGEESHLPHEAWHAVQQKQGRVRPTIQMEQGVPVNDDAGLEREADLMGDKAVRSAPPGATAPVEPAPQASPAAAAQLCTIPVVQLGKDKKKRIAKSEAKAKKKSGKKKDRGVPRGPEGKMKAETQWPAQGNDHSVYVMADEESATLAAYEEEYDAPELFWRGDTRPPAQVVATGFTTNNERAGVVDKGANRIIWRSGGDTDDILPASAVCMAKDIRGGSFFPLTGASTFYLYAVGKTRIVNTFKAQQDSEADATGSSEFRRDERYGYDPEYTDGDEASAVWQFQEYAAHRVETTEIAAAFEVSRKTLVPPGAGADVAIAGVQFRLKFHSNGPIGTIKSKGLRKQMGAVAKEAREVAAKYEDWYPDEESFLSYMGIVKPRSQGRMPATMAEAPEMVRQTQAVVVQAKAKAGRRKSPAVSDARTSGRPAAARAPEAGALPEGLRTVMEAMSGLSLADVVVHRNSAEPSRLGALAYTRGSEIHVAPGEESHLPHEAWHAVQQKQGRVRPTRRTRGAAINDDPSLERESDVMGGRAFAAANGSAGRGDLRLGASLDAGARPPQGVAAPVFQLASKVDLVAWSDANAANCAFAEDGVAADFQKLSIADQQLGAPAVTMDLEFHIHLPLSGRAQNGWAGSLFEKGKRNQGSATSQDSAALNQLVTAWKATKGANDVVDTPAHLQDVAERARAAQLAALRVKHTAVRALANGILVDEPLIQAAIAAEGRPLATGVLLAFELRMLQKDGKAGYLAKVQNRLSQQYAMIVAACTGLHLPITG